MMRQASASTMPIIGYVHRRRVARTRMVRLVIVPSTGATISVRLSLHCAVAISALATARAAWLHVDAGLRLGDRDLRDGHLRRGAPQLVVVAVELGARRVVARRQHGIARLLLDGIGVARGGGDERLLRRGKLFLRHLEQCRPLVDLRLALVDVELERHRVDRHQLVALLDGLIVDDMDGDDRARSPPAPRRRGRSAHRRRRCRRRSR